MTKESPDWAVLEKPYYSLSQIVRYWCEIPKDRSLKLDRRTLIPRPDPEFPFVEARTRLLRDAIETGQLEHEVAPEKAENYRIGEGVQWRDRVVRHEELRAWFKRYRHERPAFLFLQEKEAKGVELDWAFRHDTKLLKVARWVIREFWEGKDPSEGLTKEDIVYKLTRLNELTDGKLPSLSKNEAEAVDLVTRLDSRRRSQG